MSRNHETSTKTYIIEKACNIILRSIFTNVLQHEDEHPDVEGDAWAGPGVEGVQEDHLGLVHGPAQVDAGKQVAAVQLQVQHVLTSLLYIETLAVM